MSVVDDLIVYAEIGWVAQVVDGAVVMAYGLTATTVLMSFGISTAMATASVHAAKVVTTPASGTAPWRLVTSTIGGNNLFRLEGHVYLPSHDLNYSGGPDGGYPADYTTLAAATIRFDGSARTQFRNPSSPSDAYSARAFSHIYLTE